MNTDNHKEQNRLRQKAFVEGRKAEGKRERRIWLTDAAKKAVDKFMESKEFINQLREK